MREAVQFVLFCMNVSDMPLPLFAVWTVVEKDVHENQQWKPNRFCAPTICTHHLCLSKGELGFPRNPTERQIALHQSQTFSWKNTVLVMTGGRERTEMSEIWMMGGGGMCVLCGRLLVWLSGYYLFLWGVCISTIRHLSEPQATDPPTPQLAISRNVATAMNSGNNSWQWRKVTQGRPAPTGWVFKHHTRFSIFLYNKIVV